MKTKCVCWFFIVLCCAIVSCTQEETKEKQALAKINDFVLTLDEFQVQLAEELKLDRYFKLTQDARGMGKPIEAKSNDRDQPKTPF